MSGSIKKAKGWIKSKFIYEWNPRKKKRKIAFYGSLIHDGDLCFDIGSHMGDRVDTWMDLGARVVGIEPQPRFSEYLQKKYNGNNNYFHEPVAVGSKSGKANMKISSEYPTISTLAGDDWVDKMNSATTKNLDYDDNIEVELTTTDNLIEKYGTPDFIKIDVEGFELEVLFGLNTKVRGISFEFLNTNEKPIKDCLARLEALGYHEFNWSYEESFEFEFDTWKESEDVLLAILGYGKDVFTGDIYAR